ncbi:MAG: FAD-binding protein [Patescibacteria group bacterium]
MDSKFKLIVDSFGKDRFKFGEHIRDYTALNVGGPAKLFFIAFTTFELIKIITMCRQLNVPLFIFGTGSKMMISDDGFDGLVIKNRTKNISTISIKGKASKIGIGIEEALIEVDSGVSITKLLEYLDSQGLSKVEVSGIPGSIGGNIFISQVLQSKAKSIKVLNLECEVEEIEARQISFKKHIVLSVVFQFSAK